MTIGLTGGIGCGKSFVLSVFENLGFAVIDADKIASEVRSDSETCRFVRERFGENVILPDGKINRSALAERVFADSVALADLEAFMHPRIREEWLRRMDFSTGKNIVVEVPLLFEKNYAGDFDLSVCVATSPDVQLERLEKRGLSRAQAEARIAAQFPLSEKIRRADAVIFNDGAPEFIEPQIQELIQSFKKI